MQTHQVGAIEGNRLGAVDVTQGWAVTPFNWPQSAIGNVDRFLCRIKASPAKPVMMQLFSVVVTPYVNGGLATLSVGSASGGAQFMAAVNLKAATGTNQGATALSFVFIADTEIWARVNTTVDVPTAGLSSIGIRLAEINTDIP